MPPTPRSQARGMPTPGGAEEGAAAAESNNGQLTRAWEIWRANARRGESV